MRGSDFKKGKGLPAIVALATPPGAGALAVVRVSGEGTHQIAFEIFRAARPFEQIPPRSAVFGKILREDRSVLDEVVLTRYDAPSSYTGEDMVEVSCHGGVLITEAILGLVLRKGARLAEPGEFTLRAFLNGKMDLTQAEAVMDMIHAKTPLALRAAAEQLEGRIGRETLEIRGRILEIAAHLEAWIDFPEEEIDPATGVALAGKIRDSLDVVEKLLSTAGQGKILREGIRLAICGCPNAGKSSLLNRLLGYERAIVSEVPGTTRDTIEEFASLRGVPFRLTDTAGLREGEDAIEKEGIGRAKKAIEAADVVLEVVDASTGERGEILRCERPHLVAWNKGDIVSEERKKTVVAGDGLEVFISCKTGEGIPGLVDALVEAAGARPADGSVSFAAINARHQACLNRARASLLRAIGSLESGEEPALVSIELREAVEAVGEVAGEIDGEEILGKIFASFCVGK